MKKPAEDVLRKMRAADVMVPLPLAVDSGGRLIESQQRLLARYYIECGASAVIPGTHTGQFARGDLGLYREWLELNVEMTDTWGDPGRMFKMAAVGGARALEMLSLAAQKGYDVVMVAPTAFVDSRGRALDEKDALVLLREMAAEVPVFGFYLQPAVGGREFSGDFWSGLFEFACGAKAAPFSRARTDVLMNAAVTSGRASELVMVTGNDDYIVGDLLGIWRHPQDSRISLRFGAGLLGHFATDTHAAVQVVRKVKEYREQVDRLGHADPAARQEILELAADVTAMNQALFDTAALPGSPPFENCVYGVHYRLSRLGVICTWTDIRWEESEGRVRLEKGRPGLEKEIDLAYGSRPGLTDETFLGAGRLAQWEKELNIRVND